MPHRAGWCLLLPIIVFAGWPLRALGQIDVWSSGGTHPVTLQADADTSTCDQCHSDISKGKYVHAALTMGCTVCHQVKTDKGVTQVTLLAPVTQLCRTCHSLAQDKVLHRPYKLGDCIVCHSPHASDFPAHTWVSQQDTCLGCHVRARLKVNARKRTVTVPWGVTLTFEQMQGWMYLNLNKTLTANHPVEGHPVSGPNTALGPNAPPITCLSCHRPHASNFPHLLTKTPPEPGMALCKTCGLCMDCHSGMFPN
jgi:predicted CXXCH cytochrome family protein